MNASGVGRAHWWAAAVLAAACGCGSGVATVSGKVTYQDKPVVYGTVTMVGPDGKTGTGVINLDGSYTVDGLTPGAAQITVISRDPARRRGPHKADTASWVPLPRKYEQPATSGLTGAFKAGSNAFDIHLQ